MTNDPPAIQLILKMADSHLLIDVAERAEEYARATSDQHLLEYANGVRDAARFLLDESPSEELIRLVVQFKMND